MKTITTRYEMISQVYVEITKNPRSGYKDIELIIGGEGQKISRNELLRMYNALTEIKKDLKL